jgi:hypothetical protein
MKKELQKMQDNPVFFWKAHYMKKCTLQKVLVRNSGRYLLSGHHGYPWELGLVLLKVCVWGAWPFSELFGDLNKNDPYIICIIK